MLNPEITVGTIFVSHDYYNDITNWYRVTKRRGVATVELELLKKHNISGGGYIHSGECMPNVDEPGTPLRHSKRLKWNNTVKIGDGHAHVWDGKPGTYDYDR